MEHTEEYGGPTALESKEHRERMRELFHKWVDLVFIGIGIAVAIYELTKEEK